MAKKNIEVELSQEIPPFIYNELSWLAFNERVLEQTQKIQHPLLERVRFLAISGNNLDEFFMVRVAHLLRTMVLEDNTLDINDYQLFNLIQEKNASLIKKQVKIWRDLKKQLAKEDFFILSPKDLSNKDKLWLKKYFSDHIFPLLTPLTLDTLHPFPPIQSRGLGMIVMHTPYNNTVYDNTVSYTILPFPSQLKRFIHLPENTKKHRYMSIENCLSMFLESLFPSRHIQGYGLFRLIRDSEMELTDDSSDLIQDFEQALKLRQFGKIIQLLVDKHMPDHLKFYLCEKLDINFEDILIIDGFLGVHVLDQLVTNDRPDLLFKPYVPRLPQRLKTVDNDIFEAIHLKDIIIHHPYESFEVVQKFINQAAHDPHVLAIKQTLYRTGYDSPIVKALIKAAESGKSVTVLVEVKARFDEEINMKWAKHLEEAGVQVIYGLVGLKTHAKIALVLRQEDDKLCAYTHFGTGNYNPKTAKVYTDLSLFTADPVLGYEAGLIFNYMTGYVRPENIKEITYSPKGIRQKLLEFIEHEIRLAERKKPAYILAKINALTDEGLIQALYRASQKGVQIDLIVRGVCCLRPQMPKLSENIRVKSIIGRFLEHSRIFCFGNGHPFPSSYAKIFISSADWMQRNLDFRFEIMVPIKNETVHKQIIDQIIVANLKDQANSWKLHWDGSYVPFTSDFSGFDAQDYFMKNDSLSGRGLGVYMSSPRFKEKIE